MKITDSKIYEETMTIMWILFTSAMIVLGQIIINMFYAGVCKFQDRKHFRFPSYSCFVCG